MNMIGWHDRLERAEAEMGLSDGFRFVYGPEETLISGRIAFLSLNPGRAPSDTTAREVSDSRGNSYAVERLTTQSPITEQALRCFDFFGVKPEDVLTGVVCPFRTARWEDLSSAQKARSLALGREFWARPLARNDLDLIICCSAVATQCVTEWTGARLEAEGSAGWGNIRIKRFRTSTGVPILALPHLSRYRLFGRPGSEDAIRQLMRGCTTAAKPEVRDDPKDIPATPAGECMGRTDDLEAAVHALPAASRNLFLRLLAHPDYGCELGKMQLMITFGGNKVGGLNRKNRQWYLSKVFARQHGDPDMLLRRGFRYVDHNGTHQYWMLQGIEEAKTFEGVLVSMTGIQP